MTTPVEDEARATYRRYVAKRGEIEAGTAPWSALAEFFTEDAVFLDPAWGRTAGLAELTEFFDRSMAGLAGWTFPEGWTIVEGHRVVSFWFNRLPGARGDGTPYQVPAVSILHYAGGGKFSYEMDIMNMAELGEHLADSGWRPSGRMNAPPQRPDRDCSPPRGMVP
jgi:ketosteroid isomerase-like protein